MKNEMLQKICEYNVRTNLFEQGTGNIWTDPYLAKQMLKAHLNKDWDAASRKEETISKTVQYLESVFEPNSSILDLGCGPGLYAERFAQKGFHVTGIDFSENSLQYAQKSAMEKKLQIDYRQADFFSLNYTDQFDYVMQIYGEMNTFSDTDRDRLFTIIFNTLRQNGKFVCDVTTPNIRKDQKESTTWYTANGGFYRPDEHMVLESVVSYEDNIWLEQYIVADDNDVVVYRTWFHEYTAEAIKKVLLRIGFRSVEVSEQLYGQKQEEVNWLTVIATK